MSTRIAEVRTDAEWDEAVPLLQQLWSDAAASSIRSWREEEGYRLFGRYVDGDLVGVVGVSIQRVLHHARHAWIHDLVVDADHRSAGHGTALLEHVTAWARERDCEYVALANRLENDRALSFYEDNGLTTWGYVVEKEL